MFEAELGGPYDVDVVAPPAEKRWDLDIVVPVEDMSDLGASSAPGQVSLDFIEDDELVEVTPKQIRLRKKLRTEIERKRASRAA